MSTKETVEDIKRLAPHAFLESHIFDRIPWVFGSDRQLYVSWKARLGDLIDVDPACITIVGSAATGVSLNPGKGFKAFDKDSDIDVAIVSSHHFNIAWRYLRMNGARRLRVDARTRISWDEHVRRYIYWGTIATDRLLGVLPFGRDWLSAITEMAQQKPADGRSINLRIYADYDALRAYQVQGLRELRSP